VVALAVPFVVSREVNAQLKALVGIQGSGPTPQAQPIWYAPAELTATASPGVSPVTPTEIRSRPSTVYPSMSVPVSDIVTPSRLTEGHPATSFGVAVGFGVGVGIALGTGETVGVAAAVGSAAGVGDSVMVGVEAQPPSRTPMVRPTSTRVVR
jgi:hypothetical protein